MKKYKNEYGLNKVIPDTMIDSISEGILISDLEGNIKTINKRTLDILACSKEEIRYKKMDDLFDDWKELRDEAASCQNYLEKDISINFKSNVLRYNLTVYPIKDEGGNLKTIVHLLKDINKPRKLADRIMKGQAIYTFEKIIGQNKEFLKTIEFAKKFASSRSTILITGESGTGKEVFAQSIHNYSNRRREAFVAVNCGAIPENLIESELFGYSEGAFTGAKRSGHPGKFEVADKGTIFLDEIGTMPLDLQTRLLRAIEEGTISRIGSNKERVVDVRIIAATNKDLVEGMNKGNFRKDLFYRLNVLPLRLPPLRERRDDIPLLIEYFMKRISGKINKRMVEIPKEDLKRLMSYDWPGNIRELENYIELILNTGSVYKINRNNNIIKTKNNLANIDKKDFNLENLINNHILHALDYFEGNITNTARALGIGRNTLYRKLGKIKDLEK